MKPMTPIGQKWELAGGRPAGFDFLRIFLSISVILWHSVAVCYGLPAEQWFYAGPLKPVVWFVVPAFFALSGFLVAGSLERNNLPAFITLRVMRIFPALVAEVVISAFVIGAIFTTFSLSQYFTDQLFLSYLSNMIGYVHYYLPGVFLDLPAPGLVNAQLWTVPHELECYLALSALALIGIAKRPRLSFVLLTSLVAVLVLRDYLSDKPASTAAPPGRMLVLCFLSGVVLYLNRHRVAHSRWLFTFSVFSYAAFVLISTRAGEDLASVFVAYVTVYIGLTNLGSRLLSRIADYSYGVYLYGFPIQQTVSQLLPDHRVWYINFGISLTVTLLIAAASWHLLEYRVMLKKKSILSFVSTCEAGMRRSVAQLLRLRRRTVPAVDSAGVAGPIAKLNIESS
jgi:peptidoglycan/LPS O-acetylase OafA/YrhL